MKATTPKISAELQDFVKYQAIEDAGLTPSERVYQEALVADVLGQEAPNNWAFKRLMALYHAGKQAA